MAQAELNIAIDKMSGKIYGESDVYITHRYGKTVISHYPKLLPKYPSRQNSNSQIPTNVLLGSNDMTNTKLIITRKTSTILPSVDL